MDFAPGHAPGDFHPRTSAEGPERPSDVHDEPATKGDAPSPSEAAVHPGPSEAAFHPSSSEATVQPRRAQRATHSRSPQGASNRLATSLPVPPPGDDTLDTQLWLRDALDAVAALGATFHKEQAAGATPSTVFHAARRALLRVADFGGMAIAFADETGLDFVLDLVEPEADRELIQAELEWQIAEGTFGWALYQDRPVIVPGKHMARSVLMHVLATPSRISGMFLAGLPEDQPFIPEMGQMVLSVLMQNCAGVLESGSLYRELAEHNLRLERMVRDRTAELERSEAAARAAARAKADFLANMSHEIRTPLNGVLGMTGLLLETPLNHEQKEFAEATERSAKSLLMLVNDLLDFSKIEAGQLTLESVPVDLRLVVEDVAELLSPQAIAKGVELAVRYAPETPRRFIGDPGRIRQIVTNLAGNAVKFTSDGHVLIGVENDPSGRIRIVVEDTGIGIPKHSIGRIFEKFEQADLSTTRKHGGTGLGLAICKELASLMDGSIGIESEEGVGSAFSVLLRLQEALGTPADTHRPLEGLSFLVVSPSDLTGSLAVEELSVRGATVDLYTSTEHAARAAILGVQSSDGYRAVFLDHAAGDGACAGFVRMVQAAAGSASGTTPVVRLTAGHLPDRNDENGFALDMAKPLTERRWQDALQRLALIPAKEDEILKEERLLAAGRVLLVEDNGVNRMIALRLLEKMGVQAAVAEDGRQAVEAVQAEDFDLVLMDCQMPVLDGFEATRAIRRMELDRNTRVPIVALTASARASDRDRCFEAGMDGFLSKPLTVPELRAAVLEWLDPDAVANVG